MKKSAMGISTFLVRVILRIQQIETFVPAWQSGTVFSVYPRSAGSRIRCLPQLLTKFNVSSSLLSANSLVLRSH